MGKILLFLFTLSTPLIGITLEHAITAEELAWGLMGRKELPPNHGMAFTFPKPRYINVWMFNCFIDLSLAFLDENHRILEIYELKAYPERMDPSRPVKSLEDLASYPLGDSVRLFFQEKSIHSNLPAKYMLEMEKGWFNKNGLQRGDQIIWKPHSTNAYIIRHE